MCIPVHSPWLPGHIDVTQAILIILTMVGVFLARSHRHLSIYTYSHSYPYSFLHICLHAHTQTFTRADIFVHTDSHTFNTHSYTYTYTQISHTYLYSQHTLFHACTHPYCVDIRRSKPIPNFIRVYLSQTKGMPRSKVSGS